MKWTEKEMEFIKENCGNMNDAEMATELDRSEKSIMNKRYCLGCDSAYRKKEVVILNKKIKALLSKIQLTSGRYPFEEMLDKQQLSQRVLI